MSRRFQTFYHAEDTDMSEKALKYLSKYPGKILQNIKETREPESRLLAPKNQ